MYAKAAATVRISEAESNYTSTVSTATAEKLSKIAEAQSEVAVFMASVAADNEYRDAYRYYKYMNATIRYYENGKLIILGSDVDDARIVIGSIKN